MRHSAGLQRHKPLVGNLDTHRAWQDRSRQRAVTRRRETVLSRAPQIRTRPKDTGPSRATRDRLAERSGLRCEVCGRLLPPGTRQVHHRQPRGAGGTSRPEINELSGLLDLCGQCHGCIERERLWAKQRGLLVPRPAIPTAVPVQLRYGWVLLDDHGEYHHLPTTGAAA